MPDRYQYKCAKCRRQYSTEFQGLTLCVKCRAKLPHCDTCTRIMGRHYGYMEDRGRTIKGVGDICTSCDYEIQNKGFLHLTIRSNEGTRRKPERFLTLAGAIVNKMPPRLN